MGTTNSPQVFVKRIQAKSKAMGDVPRVGCRAAALAVKTAVLAELERDAPGLRLSGVRGTGKIGVKYIDGVNGRGRATALVVATGPVHLLERDTKAHDILPRSLSAKSARGRAGKAKALGSTARQFGPVMSSHSSGTHGKHPFERGVNAARPLTGAAMRHAMHQALAREIL